MTEEEEEEEVIVDRVGGGEMEVSEGGPFLVVVESTQEVKVPLPVILEFHI